MYLMQQETILRKCEAVLDLPSVYEKMVRCPICRFNGLLYRKLTSRYFTMNAGARGGRLSSLLHNCTIFSYTDGRSGSAPLHLKANEANELHAANSLQYLHHNCDVDVQCRLPVLSSSGQAFFAIVATNSFFCFSFEKSL